MPSLYPYQRDGVEWLRRTPSALLADQMGLGKTPQGCAVLNEPDVNRALVICPASLKTNWLRELAVWCPLLSVGIAAGNNWPEGRNVVIINYDILARHSDRLRAETWDCLIIDEAHNLRNQKAKRTQEIFGSRKLTPVAAKRKILLTGTPIVNRPIEIYPLLRYLDPQAWPSYDDFGMRYCGGEGKVVIQQWGAGHADWQAWCRWSGVRPSKVMPLQAWRDFKEEKPDIARGMRVKLIGQYTGAQNLEELKGKLYSTIMLRRLKKDVLPDLPPKVRQLVELDADGAVGRLVREEKRLAREAFGDDYAEALIARNFALAVEGMSPGQKVAYEGMARARHELALLKLPLVVEHVVEAIANSGKVVVFAHHKEMVAGLLSAFSGAVRVVGGMTDAAKQSSVDAFQGDPAVRLFVGSLSAKEGLTLTAASHMVLAETFWTPGDVEQMEDRLHRIGQAESVLCQWLVFAGSLDAHIAQTVIRKQKVIDRALNV